MWWVGCGGCGEPDQAGAVVGGGVHPRPPYHCLLVGKYSTPHVVRLIAMTDLRKSPEIQRAIVAFWMATTRPAQYEALAQALAEAKKVS